MNTMRGQKEICLLCRHVVRPLRSNDSAKRNASTKKEPYNLSRTVIDLDAMDSKFVKRFENTELDTSKLGVKVRRVDSSWMSPLRMKRIQNTSSQRKELKNLQDAVNGLDLLTYALIGAVRTKSVHSSQLHHLLEVHGIQPFDNSETKLKELTSAFNGTQSIILDGTGFPSQNSLKRCKSWATLRRIVSTLSSTMEGCEFLAKNSDLLAQSIKNCRMAQVEPSRAPPTAHHVLLFLNNLTLNFGTRGIQIGPWLCNAGLYHAATTDTLPAISMYLRISVENQYPTSWYTAQAIRRLAVLFMRKRNLDIAGPEKKLQRQAELTSTLISGRATDNGLLSSEDRQPCFVDLISHKHRGGSKAISLDPHSTLILMLGEMGHGQTLLHEWERLGNPKPERGRLAGQYISAMAFIIANNRPKALAILEATSAADSSPQVDDRPELKDDPSTEEMTQFLFARHYDMYKLMPTVGLKEKMRTPIPKEPSEALKAIDALVVTEHKISALNHGPRNVIDWAIVNGQEGLQIRDPDGVELYFKPAQ